VTIPVHEYCKVTREAALVLLESNLPPPPEGGEPRLKAEVGVEEGVVMCYYDVVVTNQASKS
jgi:hypothetical protein